MTTVVEIITPEDCLRTHDRELWGGRVQVPVARKQCADACGLEIGPEVFARLCKERCTYFRHAEFRGRSAPTRGPALSFDEWDSLQIFLKRMHRDGQLAEDYPLDWIIRYLRLKGRKASRTILRNCTVFQKLTGGRYFA